jgi:hypothetical protein
MFSRTAAALSSTLTRITMAAALVACVVSNADASFDFNPTGGATVGGFNPGTFNVTSLQFSAGNAVAVGGVPAGGLHVGSTFQLFYQTNLVGLNTPNGPISSIAGLNNTYQITEVSTFTEVVTSISTGPTGTTAVFALSGAGPNRTNIYFEDLTLPGAVKADAVTGNGYSSGTQILTKSVTTDVANFTNSSQGGGAPQVALNQSGSSNYAGVQTDQGSGTTTIGLSVGPYLANFFQTPGLITSSFSTNATLPFLQIAPSNAFNNPLAPGTPTIIPVVGAINGESGTDLLLQLSGAAESFAIPEPASVVMTLLGFAGVGAGSVIARRRKAQA